MSTQTIPIAFSCGTERKLTVSVGAVRKRQLGSSDLMVSEISLGSWLTYGGGVDRERAEACVAKAFELGIDFIDTANVYSGGRAEEFLGEVLASRARDSYVLATKLYWPMPGGGSGLSREQVFTQIDASLGRLRTDYIDLYQCHRYDWNVPLEETMEGLTEVVRQGKARYLGFSEWREENVASAIIGASRPEQVEDNAGASGVELDPGTLSRIDEILGDSVAWEPPDSAR